MKKIAPMLAAVLMCCVFSSAAIADQVQTVSVDVPSSEPDFSYTVTIPADCTIEYGNTEPQSIGTVSITGINSEAFAQFSKVVRFYPSTFCVLINENGDRIGCTFGELSPDGTTITPIEEYIMSGTWDCYPGISSDTSIEYGVQVSDWSTAVPGTTYSLRVGYLHKLTDA